MQFWDQLYCGQLYHLDYDMLTHRQTSYTKRMLKFLDLKWEDACLSPEDNKRSVKTASQEQVRQRVYKGSSQAWRKFEHFIDGAFDTLYKYST